MKCSFTKYYEEPNKKYVCMSTSLFFKKYSFLINVLFNILLLYKNPHLFNV